MPSWSTSPTVELSNVFSAVAFQRLRTAQARLSSAKPEHTAELEQLVTEGHFGFMQALGTWSQNPEALKGLRQLQNVMVQLALRARDRHRIERLLQELPHQDTALRAQLEAWLRQHRAANAEAERLTQLGLTVDLRVGAAQRRRFFGAVAVGAVLWTLASGMIGFADMSCLVTAAFSFPALPSWAFSPS